MDEAELVRRYPLLYHLTAAGSWPGIREHGLLPAATIVRTAGLPAGEAEALLRSPRAASVRLDHPRLGPVVLRDQSPLRPRLLESRLVGATPAEWLALLNDRVFLWLHPVRVRALLTARRSRGQEHEVLVVDTAALLAAHGPRVRLSPINSGSALWPNAPVRGPGTFTTVADYPYAERRRGRDAATAVVELAVPGGVPDLARFVVRVERVAAADAAQGGLRAASGTTVP